MNIRLPSDSLANLKPILRAFSQFTLLGLITLISIILVLAFLAFVKMQRERFRSARIKCVSNLKNVGLSFRIFATDNNDHFPFELTNTGTAQFTGPTDAFRHFLALSNELSTPKLLICPQDYQRIEAPSFATLSNSNLSYFVGITARETLPQSWLTGDRNLMNHGFHLGPGLHAIGPESQPSWSHLIHNFRGNVVMGDGSVQQLTNERMPQAVQEFRQLTNQLHIP